MGKSKLILLLVIQDNYTIGRYKYRSVIVYIGSGARQHGSRDTLLVFINCLCCHLGVVVDHEVCYRVLVAPPLYGISYRTLVFL